ncbi:MAG TPA: ATP-binding protein [Bryobacteraceae bacterium]|nr:ATP-binding protein [Bryobacteraceae bacterium]
MVSELKIALRLPAESHTAVVRWTAILAGILFGGGLHYLTPLSLPHWHNILQHLYYLPIVFAGMYFGWRGGLAAGLLAGLSSLPYSFRLMGVTPAYASDQLLDIVVFCGAGVFTGFLAQRDREHRMALERTTTKLTEVYKELQDSFERVKRAERLSAAGQLSAGLAHEIRNPLASLAGAAGVLRRGQVPDQTRLECVSIIEKECERLNQLLSQFLDFARPRPPQYREADLRSILEPVADLAAHAAGSKQVRIRLDLAPELPAIECDPEQIKQAVLNLLINAVHASASGGEVVVAVRASNGRISIQVQDQGSGIEPEHMNRIFDPFFTTKEAGTGLGLSVVHQIVEQHGGTIAAEPNLPRGAIFRITLPRWQGTAR